ncbi:alpha/beta hydrolase [Citreicella sp. C3M06]|uniref:alpha/beta hydrolase n=1 Tax=Citreicella sp. C3M06 TaxID=2841564 RepID=UPI001C0988AF|nr:alpha/beta hydrolase [Citreicella sp. C3M06]MBU2963270.1 alpha/beta hydrolase [Citreicella sp. C3M06]
MTPERVFDGALLRADLFKGARKRLFVSFRQRVGNAGSFEDVRPVRAFTARGYAHLHIQSLWNDWFVNAETTALEDALRGLAQRYRRAVAMGFSMGGYGALRFSAVLGLAQVIVIAPQVSVHPDEVPWDRRYRDEAPGFDRQAGDLARHGHKSLEGALLCDPFVGADLAHARMVQALFPKLRICRLPGGGHPPSRVLRQGGRLPDLQAQLVDGGIDAAEIIALHRASRRCSPSYFRHMQRYAKVRRPALAERLAAMGQTAVPVVDKG